MRETKLERIKVSKIRTLTLPQATIALKKCAGEQFALTDQNLRVLFSFESPNLTEFLMNQKRRRIRSVRMKKLITEHGTGVKRSAILELQFQDGRTLVLDERDRLFAFEEVTPPCKFYSPIGLWGLLPEEPILWMLLTGGMVDFIESLCAEDQVAPVLRSMWNDWMSSSKQEPQSKRTRIIKGEFGRFKAKPINSKIVKFDTT
jgi:hypothetical protein